MLCILVFGDLRVLGFTLDTLGFLGLGGGLDLGVACWYWL